MPKYRSCKNCPAYKYAFLSKVHGKCALQFEYLEDGEKIVPLENCEKPKNIIEMNITAKKRGIVLPGCDELMSEKEYNAYRQLKNFTNVMKAVCENNDNNTEYKFSEN